MTRRTGFKLLLFLLALLVGGAIINVAVAWAGGRWHNLSSAATIEAQQLFGNQYGWYIRRKDSMTSTYVRSWVMRPAQDFSWQHRTGDESPYWCLFQPDSPTDMDIWAGQAHGWPFRSMLCDVGHLLSPIIPKDFPNGILLSPRSTDMSAVQVLPLIPIWPGFAINTIFYAAVLWVLFAVPMKVRRRRRIKRGQCASCGYSLRGTPQIEKCPECGAIA